MFPLATDLAAGFTLSELTIALLVGSLILIVCVAAIRLSTRTGMPSLLIYLAVGLAVGEKGLGIGFESEQLTQVLGYAALILILAEGGLSTQWSGIRGAVGPALILSTVGVVVSVAVVATAGHYVLGWSWVTALLIGAILSSTDAAAVFAVLRNVPLPRRLTGMLEAEAGFNDAPVVILVTALSAYAAHTGEVISPLWLPFVAIAELAGGALIGLLVGYLGGRLMRLSAAGASGLFSIGIIAVTVLAYAVAASLHLSGFIATYLAALVLGNMGLPHRAAVHAFATGVGWLAQIGLFVLLGLLASPSGFPTQVVPALCCSSWPGRCRWLPRRSCSAIREQTGSSCPGPACAARFLSSSPPCPSPPRHAMSTGSTTWSSSWSSSSPWFRHRRCRGWRGSSGSPRATRRAR